MTSRSSGPVATTSGATCSRAKTFLVILMQMELLHVESKPHLTPREREVIEHLLQGEKREAIAVELDVSVWTVDFHLLNIRRKLGASSMIEVAIFFASDPAKLRS